MPIYEYRCNDCGERFEHFVRSRSDRPGGCPSCDSSDLEKLPSAFAVGKVQADGDSAPSCCGLTSPCSDPKRCCER
jgi:putative FmdB family regulatory protein